MRTVILILGDIAAGKSAYAKFLAQKYNLPYFLKDTFKEELSNSIGYVDRETNRKLSEGSFLTMVEISKRLMEQGISFILESNFRPNELNVYEKLIMEYKYDSLSIVLQGDTKVLHERYLKRIEDGRHETHLVVDLRNYDEYRKLMFETRKTIPFGRVIILDATTFDFYDIDVLQYKG